MTAINLQNAELVPLSGIKFARKFTIGAVSSDVDVVVNTTGTFELVNVPAGVLVTSVRANVDTAFTTNFTITIGDSDDVDGYFTDTDLAPESSDTLDVYNVGGGAYVDGRRYPAAQTIQAVGASATATAGKATIVIEYEYIG